MAIVFNDDFETGDFSSWTTDDSSTYMTVTAAAALAGTAGYELTAGCNGCGEDVIELGNGTVIEGRAHFGYRFDLNDLDITGLSIDNFVLLDGNPGGELLLQVFLDESGGNHRFIFRHQEDDNTNHDITYTIGSGAHTYDVRIVQASNATANNGIFQLVVDGAIDSTITGLDNYNKFDTVLGAFSLTMAPDQGGAGGSGSAYVDDVTLRDDDIFVFGSGTNEFRLLGMSSDSGHLYVTGKKDGNLHMYLYDLPALKEDGPEAFGPVTNAELDAETRGIYARARPMSDKELYVYGRDGNDRQVQYQDLNQGTAAGWSDLSPGTDVWGTARVAVAVLPDPLDRVNNVIVAMDNGVIYHSKDALNQEWHTGGTITGLDLRDAARHPLRNGELIFAGTVSGTIGWSNNYGASFEDISPGAGTIGIVQKIGYLLT